MGKLVFLRTGGALLQSAALASEIFSGSSGLGGVGSKQNIFHSFSLAFALFAWLSGVRIFPHRFFGAAPTWWSRSSLGCCSYPLKV